MKKPRFGIYKVLNDEKTELYTTVDKAGKALIVYGKAVQEKKYIQRFTDYNLIIRSI